MFHHTRYPPRSPRHRPLSGPVSAHLISLPNSMTQTFTYSSSPLHPPDFPSNHTPPSNRTWPHTMTCYNSTTYCDMQRRMQHTIPARTPHLPAAHRATPTHPYITSASFLKPVPSKICTFQRPTTINIQNVCPTHQDYYNVLCPTSTVVCLSTVSLSSVGTGLCIARHDSALTVYDSRIPYK